MAQTTDYLYGFQYLNGQLQFFPHAEGYVKPNGTNSYLYVYQYKDHLGNVRLSYADCDGDGVINPATEILEENNYYPFGLKHKGYNEIANSCRSEAAEQYKYNGKEYEDSFGLSMYEMDLRQYDPAIARWVAQDPVIHHEFSPYSAFDNNPAYWSDPSGADATGYTLGGKFVGASFTGQDAIDAYLQLAGESSSEEFEAIIQDMYELSDSDSGISFTGGGGDGNGGGIPTKFTTRQRLEKAVNVTDQVLKSADMISAIDNFIALATKSGSKEFYKLMGKVGGNLSNVTGVLVSGLEYTNGKISGLELTFDVGTSVGSIWISAQVGVTFGGGWGFVAGAATGVVSEYVIKPLYTNYVYPQLVVPTQKIYNSSWTGFYNNIIYNISRYH